MGIRQKAIQVNEVVVILLVLENYFCSLVKIQEIAAVSFLQVRGFLEGLLASQSIIHLMSECRI